MEEEQESMASRRQAVVHQEKKGEGVPIGKQKAGAGADVRSRRVLGDIGNVVDVRAPEGELLPQITRPVTRSFHGQLLFKAQEGDGVNAADKKSVAGTIDLEVVRGRTKGAKQKDSFKPKSDAVIEISPDKNEKKGQTFVINVGSSSRFSRRKIHTFSSVLSARSKFACEVAVGLTAPITNIDASDIGDQLAVVDYVEDLYKFYKVAENNSRPLDYMKWQLEINEEKRALLVDWLIQVHHKLSLMPETLYLTLYIVDRYLSVEAVLWRELQLVGVSAMLIACKYEEIWAPEVNEFMCISTSTRERILVKEKRILDKLEWNLTVPTLYVFLVRFIKAALCDKQMELMVFFLAELGLMQYSLVAYQPSMIAAAAVYAAQCTFKKNPRWTETLKFHTGFSEPELLHCARILVKCHVGAPAGMLKGVIKKYSRPDLGAVALYPPAFEVLED